MVVNDVGLQTTGPWGSVFNLANTAIGAGVLSFPLAYKSLGYFGGAVLCTIVALIDILTLATLVKYSDQYKAQTYQAMIKKAYGYRLALFNSAATLLMTFGALTAYLIIVGDTFSPILGQYVFGHDSKWSDRRLVIAISALVVALPFSLQRHLSALAGISSTAVLVMVYTGFVIFGKLIQSVSNGSDNVALNMGQVQPFKIDKESLRAIPIMLFAYQCHAQLTPIYYELDWEQKFSRFGFRTKKGVEKEAKISDDIEEQSLLKQEQREIEMSQLSNNRGEKVYNSDQTDKIPPKAPKTLRNTNSQLKNIKFEDQNSHPQDLEASKQRPSGSLKSSKQRYSTGTLRNIYNQQKMNTSLKAQKMFYVILFSVIEMYVLYNLVGVSGYLLFGQDVQSNVIKNFGHTDVLIQVTRGLIGLAVLFHYPINIHVSRSALDSLRGFVFREPWSDNVSYFRLVQNTVLIFIITVGVAVLVDDLGIVFEIMGGTSATILCFIFPGLILIKDYHDTRTTKNGYTIQAIISDEDNNDPAPSFRNSRQNLHRRRSVENGLSKDSKVQIVDEISEVEKAYDNNESNEEQSIEQNGQNISNSSRIPVDIQIDKQPQQPKLKLILGIVFIILGVLVTAITITSIVVNPRKGKE